jgi:hypothetical protein
MIARRLLLSLFVLASAVAALGAAAVTPPAGIDHG